MANGPKWYARIQLISGLILSALAWIMYALTEDSTFLVVACLVTIGAVVVIGLYGYSSRRKQF